VAIPAWRLPAPEAIRIPGGLILAGRQGILTAMAGAVTTVTTKMQVTIPEEIRRIFPVEAGSRLSLSVEADTLVARRIRGVKELQGCLRSNVPFPGVEEEKAAVAAQRAQHDAAKSRRPCPDIQRMEPTRATKPPGRIGKGA
jgi:bifunctional DNA-binding transcriptional regulator/antitoxin component of YhaV-PrlF toxin-antitoxin module